MNYLAENALPIWVAGAVLVTMTGVAYWQLRSRASLAAMLAVVLGTALLLAYEHFVETPREAVERTLYELADVVESNDVAGTLSYLAPGASQLRQDVETLMPQAKVDKANVVGTPVTTVDRTTSPPRANVACRGFLHATLKRNGMVGGDLTDLVITFVERDGRWLVEDYTSSRDWRRAATGGVR
jgi:hypothetical protein